MSELTLAGMVIATGIVIAHAVGPTLRAWLFKERFSGHVTKLAVYWDEEGVRLLYDAQHRDRNLRLSLVASSREEVDGVVAALERARDHAWPPPV